MRGGKSKIKMKLNDGAIEVGGERKREMNKQKKEPSKAGNG